MKRLIVSNTGPLLHLSEAKALDLLSLSGEVHIPKSVGVEIGKNDPVWTTPIWIHVTPLITSRASEATAWKQAGWLDTGEADTKALARQINADWILTDDTAARLFAQTLGLEVHGSLGIVLWAVAIGHISRSEDAYAILERLGHSSLWISPKVMAEAVETVSVLIKQTK